MKDYLTNERVFRYSQATAEQMEEELGLRPEGLSQKDAEKQRLTYGVNEISGQEHTSLAAQLRRAFINPFSVVLILLACISFLTNLFTTPHHSNMTVVIIGIMLVISGIIRFTQELHSKRISDSLIHLVNSTVRVRRSGQWIDLDASELAVGDLVRLSAGERVSADIRLLKTRDCFVSQSVITGESEIREKFSAPLTTAPHTISDYSNTLFLGSTLVSGSCYGIVLAVGSDTVYGGITADPSRSKNSFDRGANSIAWVLIRFMSLLVPIVFIASGLTKGNWLAAFLFSLSVAVGLTPELLPMVITACLAKGSFSMGQKQTVVKNINAMQGFGSMDVLCVDKTGTLTGDTLLLEYYMDILGNESPYALDLCFLNSFYHSGIQNPLDMAVLRIQDLPGSNGHFDELLSSYTKIDELPFDYSRKTASVLLENPDGRLLISKGSIDEIISRCSSVLYQGKVLPIEEDKSESMHAVVDEMLEDGMKVLAVAIKHLDSVSFTESDESDLTLVGYIAFFDAPKQSAAGALQKLKDLHLDVKVLTGDHAAVAVSVCRRLGLPFESILTGSEFEQLSDNDAQVRIENTSVFAELTPKQKAAIVDLLRSNGHSVGFLGDGMNDLPAVLNADVGISVDTAVQSVKDAADVILLKKDLGVLEEGILEGRKSFANMSKYIKITASSNLGNILAIVISSVVLPFFPMTSIQILLLNLLYDILCLVLPWDHVDRSLCSKPLDWSGNHLSRFMLFFGPLSSLFDIITFAFLFLFLCPTICGGAFSTLLPEQQLHFIALFQTGWFLESMWTQVLILHLLRTPHIPIFQSRPSRSMILVTISGILIFTLLAMTPAGRLIGLTTLPAVYFIFLLLVVFAYLLIVTLAKKIYIKRYHSLL